MDPFLQRADLMITALDVIAASDLRGCSKVKSTHLGRCVRIRCTNNRISAPQT